MLSPLPAVTGDHVLGIDIYHGDYTGDDPNSVQFHTVANAVGFVIHKATQGTKGTDPCFKNAWPRIKAVGIIRGAYSFFLPNADPIAQADNLIATVKAAGGLQIGDLPLVLDVETAGPNIGAEAYAAAQHIKQATGFWPIVYASQSFYQDNLAARFPADMHFLWLARYGPRPGIGEGMWQYSEGATCSGCPAKVDADVYFGTRAQLLARCVRQL
jgi:GH25 family lysozyme M1 (1,4-beta-N-acetylmuramidase)